MIVGIHSDGFGSGKDSIAQVFRDEFGFTLFGFSECVYEVSYELVAHERFGSLEEWVKYVNAHKYDTDEQEGFWVRKLLQSIGGFKRSITNMWWVNYWEQRVSGMGNVVVPSVRFSDSEAPRIRDLGGVFIKVIRPGIKVDSDPSENGMRDWKSEYIIDNDGTLEMLKSISRIAARDILERVAVTA